MSKKVSRKKFMRQAKASARDVIDWCVIYRLPPTELDAFDIVWDIIGPQEDYNPHFDYVHAMLKSMYHHKIKSQD